MLLRQAPARGAPDLDGLELPVVQDPAPHVEDDIPEGRAHGHFDEARVVDLAGQGEDLCPLRLLGPYGGVPSAAVADDVGDVCPGFHVVYVGGFAPEALVGREGRPRVRHPPFALNGGHQGGLLAADEGAGPFLDVQVEGEVRPHDVVADEAVLSRLGDGAPEPFDRQGVFGAAVDVALVGAYGVGAQHHALYYRVGVALEERPVHERTRVALVGVADDVFFVTLGLPAEFPFSARGKPAAASSP